MAEPELHLPLSAAPRDSGGARFPDPFWRSLHYYNLYRLVVAGLLLASAAFFGTHVDLASRSPRLFFYGGTAWLVFAGIALALIRARKPRFNLQLAMQVAADVAFVVLLTYASGGMQSGLGLLLLASLAGAGLISRGRLTLFFAALATIGVLLQQTAEVLWLDASPALFVQAGLLSTGYFATAWSAHMLAQYTAASEQLALKRGIDLANLAQVNQLVIQDMQDGVVVVDEDGRVRQQNSRADRLLGRTGGAAEGMKLEEYSTVLAGRLKAWREDLGSEFELLRVGEDDRPVRIRFVPIVEDRDLGVVIFIEDMTRAEARARQLKLAALGRLTANIAHEIRNPLSAISHAAELLLEDKGGDPTHARLLRIIHDNTRRLDHMVQDVLQLNRRDRARQETIRTDAFLRQFAEEFAQVEKVSADAFALEFEPGITVSFDRGHLDQVLWNLCRNALRYCRREPGSIRLRLGAGDRPGTAFLEVVDDGPGVDRELRGRLFEPFFTTAPSGTGLGLYIAREICDANGAGLDFVESQGGAHFRIICRREHAEAQGTVAAAGR